MGRKGKPEERLDYEAWISTTGGWKRIEEDGNGGVFNNKNRVLLLAESKSHGADVIESMVIERRPIAVFNGPANSAKQYLAAMERKKEEAHAQIPGAGPQKDDIPQGSSQHGGEAAPGGRVGEGAPAGPG